VATRAGAAKPAEFSKMIVDSPVRPKAVAFPTDARLMHRVWERLVRLAEKNGVALRQSSERVDKHALIAHRRYTRAKQLKRANRALRTLRTFLGPVMRDIVRKIKGNADWKRSSAYPSCRAPGPRPAREPARPKEPALGLRPEALIPACAGR